MYISIATALVKGPFGIASRRASKITSGEAMPKS